MAAKKGMTAQPLGAVARELAVVLGVSQPDLSGCRVLLAEWSCLVPAGLAVAEVLRIEVTAILSNPALWSHRPYPGRLLAARWLLGLGSCTVEDARRDARESDLIIGMTDQSVTLKSSRAVIAFECLRWEPHWENERRLSATARTAFNPNKMVASPRTRDVAVELERVIEDRRLRLTEESMFLAGRTRVWEDSLGSIVDRRAGRQDSDLGDAFDHLAGGWNEPSRHYPEHLTPSVLAANLTLSPVTDYRGDDIEDVRVRLYGDSNTYGGELLLAALDNKRRVVMLGNPGGGKSTGLIATVVDRIQSGTPALFVRLSSLRSPQSKPRRWTLERVVRYLASVAVSDMCAPNVSNKKIAAALLGNERSLIALDGLDEVQDEHSEHVHALIRILDQFLGTVLISSRWTGYTKPPGAWQQVSVDNLSLDRAKAFLDRWFLDTNPAGHERALATLEARAQSSSRSQLTEIPVLLGIVAVVAGEHDVPATEALLYQRYVSMFLEGYWRPRSVRVGLESRLEHLDLAKALAWSMATGLSARLDGNRWNDVVTPHRLFSVKGLLPSLLTLTHVHGLLVPQGVSTTEDQQEYRWLHRTVHEHLVGAHLAGQIDVQAPHLGLPLELLMGAPQWIQPLRHLVGLLDEADQEALVLGLNELADEGDPGAVIEYLVVELAEATPRNSRTRDLLALEFARTRSLFGLWHIHTDTYLQLLKDVLRTGDEKELIRSPAHLLDATAALDVDYVRELVECQREAPYRLKHIVEVTSTLLSASDPDEALRFLVENRLDERYVLPCQTWGRAPSSDAVRQAIEVIQQWPPGERLNYLHLLSCVGVDLDQLLEPEGILSELDVRTARSWCRYYPDNNESPVGSWPTDVAEAVLGGSYGAVWAFGAAFYEQGDLPYGVMVGSAAQLALEVRALSVSDVTADEDIDVDSAIQVLLGATMDVLRDERSALSLVRAAQELLRARDVPAVGLCMQAHWALARTLYHLSTDDGDDPTRSRNLSDSLLSALTKTMLRHSTDVLCGNIEESDPNSWIVNRPRYADFEIIKVMRNANRLSLSKMVDLIVWAGREEIGMLHYLSLGSAAVEVAQLTEEREPRVLAANSWAGELSRAGVLWEWREKLIDADVEHAKIMQRWSST